MTRIVAGRLGGRRLVTPRTDATRPTSERVREALFSRLDHQGVLTGARVLDLFAGSGALGLEALSRGAVHASFVDLARPAVGALRDNVKQLDLVGSTRIHAAPVARLLATAPSELFDLVFIDPPYDLAEDELAATLDALAERWLSPDGLVLVERSRRTPEPAWPQRWARIEERRYGETTIWIAEPVTCQA